MADESLDVQLAVINGKLDKILQSSERHSLVLYGETGANGLSGRVKSLEESEDRRIWQIRSLFGGLVAATGALIVNWVKK